MNKIKNYTSKPILGPLKTIIRLVILAFILFQVFNALIAPQVLIFSKVSVFRSALLVMLLEEINIQVMYAKNVKFQSYLSQKMEGVNVLKAITYNHQQELAFLALMIV